MILILVHLLFQSAACVCTSCLKSAVALSEKKDRGRKGDVGSAAAGGRRASPSTRRQCSTVRRVAETLVLNPAWELCAFEQFLPLIPLNPSLPTSNLPGWKSGRNLPFSPNTIKFHRRQAEPPITTTIYRIGLQEVMCAKCPACTQ